MAATRPSSCFVVLPLLVAGRLRHRGRRISCRRGRTKKSSPGLFEIVSGSWAYLGSRQARLAEESKAVVTMLPSGEQEDDTRRKFGWWLVANKREELRRCKLGRESEAVMAVSRGKLKLE
ncbi:hypothetical protein Droror1_Dr00003781 [Drosera rotundifolia]